MMKFDIVAKKHTKILDSFVKYCDEGKMGEWFVMAYNNRLDTSSSRLSKEKWYIIIADEFEQEDVEYVFDTLLKKGVVDNIF